MPREDGNRTEAPRLVMRPEGLSLVHGGQAVRADLARMLPRVRQDRLGRELLVRAARVKGTRDPWAVDATAGLGDDAFLLAAAGFRVRMYERDATVAALLADALRRAGGCAGHADEDVLPCADGAASVDAAVRGTDEGSPDRSATLAPEAPDPRLAAIVRRMELVRADSVAALRAMAGAGERPDVVYLDPMFPAKRKSSAAKKKLQVIQAQSAPCDDEPALLEAALGVRPRKVVVKRPIKGAPLADARPSYSLGGKAIRYDVYVG